MKKPGSRRKDEPTNFYETMPLAGRSGMPWGKSEYTDRTETARTRPSDQAMRRLALITLTATVILALIMAALFAAGLQMIAAGFGAAHP